MLKKIYLKKFRLPLKIATMSPKERLLVKSGIAIAYKSFLLSLSILKSINLNILRSVKFSMLLRHKSQNIYG